MAEAVQAIYGMSYEDLCNTLHFLKLMYGKLSGADAAAAGITLIYGLVFIGGGLGKMNKLLKGMKVPKALRVVLRGVPAAHTLSQGPKLAPKTAWAGMVLKNIGE